MDLSFIRRGTLLFGMAAASSLLYLFARDPRQEDRARADESAVVAGPHPASLIAEPATLLALEGRGFGLNRVLGAPGRDNRDLAESRAYADLVRTLVADLVELDARPNLGGERAPSHPWNRAWLTDPDARFELVGVVPRLDRAFAEPGTCGELRLVYRLALGSKGRPGTRPPMTLSVLMVPRADAGTCTELARDFLSLPASGAARVAALASILTRRAGSPRRLEVNLQSLYGSSLGQDSEDHAESLMRSFDVTEGGVAARALLNTPREDLGDAEKAALASEVVRRFAEIDLGTFVMPEAFAARRAFTVTPGGLAERQNRPWATLFGAEAARKFAGLPYEGAKLVRSPAALLRRLDGGTCQGCHASRSVAGFHLLGEERGDGAKGALAVGRSNHLEEELPWRERALTALAKGAVYIEPRPFAERAVLGPGGVGARCGLGDPGFRELGCASGLFCKGDVVDELGACTPADGGREGVDGPRTDR